MSNVRRHSAHTLSREDNAMTRTPVVLSLVVLSACATQDQIVGPAATVADTAISIDTRSSDICILSAVNGKTIETSVEATARNSGYGILRTTLIDRKVAAKPMDATLICRPIGIGGGTA